MPKTSSPKKSLRIKTTSSSEVIDGYCVKCKGKKRMNNHRLTQTKNGRSMMKGECDCGCKMCKFVSTK
jgi:hypothetical protein